MQLVFYKYQGTGNDFIIIDNRNKHFDSKNEQFVSFLCNRRFGVGADGLMLLEDHPEHAFTMRYYNSDGKEASMCGNGGRCISAFAVHQGVVNPEKPFFFMAVDGLHEAIYSDQTIALKMGSTSKITIQETYTFLDTGSPHCIQFVENCDSVDVQKEGSQIRYSDTFKPAGTNANFVQQITDTKIRVRTYERGVENETLSCGTGAVASAIATAIHQGKGNEFDVQVQGGHLKVKFEMDKDDHPCNIWLSGPATFVFKGSINAQ
jgi:diaminopimelate epimerase